MAVSIQTILKSSLPKGDPGFAGSQGELGFTGSQGELGYTGSAGFTGSFGFTGSQGEKGYTGSSGVDGFTGSRGDDGTSVKIVGLVATANDLPDPYNGDVGDGYIVADTGNLWTWSGSTWIEVGRILGYTGSQGPAGGYTGSKGDPGVAASFTTRAYTGDGSTTVFGITEGNTVQTVMVFLNGVNQRPTDDYTVAGSTLTFATAPSAGELIIIREMPQAATGYTGSIGVAGFTGSQGIPGEAAAIGYSGSAGFTGSQGNIGFTGSQGDIGFTGSQGYTGSQGDQGNPGDPGFTGSRGDDGTSITIRGTFATVADLPDDSSGFVGDAYVIVETGEIWVWDGSNWNNGGRFVGYTGSQGVPGPIGFTGSAGSGGTGGGARYINLAMSGEITPPIVGQARFYPPESLTITKIYASISSQATGGAFTFQLNKNGVNTGVTLLIPSGSFTMIPVITSILVNSGDYLTLDITGVGSRDLHIKMEYELSV